ncbi:carboxynorspermidine decarboxylase [Flavilitoribacter nigricans]|uniref:Carboxynorspermidine/carboxyspermidine decarboxylase n=1 Tax=Flavilitoribacter nigricans (strain ATCC 23147 / DSM 23189 / NBRC 102662 / NCIMB 1420 / SS-2) TaxID=1122177 RepID=A0A2D0NBU1_FLAN2|nr:carboxynorspermidine decarboxylase [Flavilitoribacter nigricans]PHN05965.1 carboxynorspermidine decarboxylase [Flavilitoribacter nigricans DSM 23189 = NBRC 102662]
MNYQAIPSPSFVLEMARLRKNLELIRSVREQAGVDIILALKGFSMWRVFPIVGQYLSGATASSLDEARLIYDEMGVRAYTYSPAYLPEDFADIMRYSSHITFNSLNQFHRYHEQVQNYPEPISMGLRVNPEYSEVETDLYNPASPVSRLGETAPNLGDRLPEGIEGLHFHTLCESSSYTLEKTLQAFEKRFAKYFPQLKWVNFGGGHLMTRKDYDVDHLVKLLQDFRQRHTLQVILEPGSAIAWETGVLVATVLDIIENHGVKTAILDVSFTAHMPDTLEMPYRPRIVGATDPVDGKPTYRIGGVSCLAGDYMEAYSFEKPLEIGDRMVFEDMIHYTMVKTTTFNGVKHPNICILQEDGELEIVKTFDHQDFKNRLS